MATNDGQPCQTKPGLVCHEADIEDVGHGVNDVVVVVGQTISRRIDARRIHLISFPTLTDKFVDKNDESWFLKQLLFMEAA